MWRDHKWVFTFVRIVLIYSKDQKVNRRKTAFALHNCSSATPNHLWTWNATLVALFPRVALNHSNLARITWVFNSNFRNSGGGGFLEWGINLDSCYFFLFAIIESWVSVCVGSGFMMGIPDAVREPLCGKCFAETQRCRHLIAAMCFFVKTVLVGYLIWLWFEDWGWEFGGWGFGCGELLLKNPSIIKIVRCVRW